MEFIIFDSIPVRIRADIGIIIIICFLLGSWFGIVV
jgi:hypothetical protein